MLVNYARLRYICLRTNIVLSLIEKISSSLAPFISGLVFMIADHDLSSVEMTDSFRKFKLMSTQLLPQTSLNQALNCCFQIHTSSGPASSVSFSGFRCSKVLTLLFSWVLCALVDGGWEVGSGILQR